MNKNIVYIFLILLSIMFFFYGLTQQITARREADNATQMKNDLLKCEQLANANEAKAEMALKHAEELAAELERAIQNALKKN